MQFSLVTPPLKSVLQLWQKLHNDPVDWSFWFLAVSYENQIKKKKSFLYTVLQSVLRGILLLEVEVKSCMYPWAVCLASQQFHSLQTSYAVYDLCLWSIYWVILWNMLWPTSIAA